MYKGYKIRLYPTVEQEEKLWKHIHACRFIWNYMLDLQEANYKNGIKYLSGFDMIKLLTPLKKQCQYMWLNEVSNKSLQIICTDLDRAYKAFFNNNKKKPTYKTKKTSRIIFPIYNENIIRDKIVAVQKVGKITINEIQLKCKKIINPRIYYENKKWILSFCVEHDSQVQPTKCDQFMGIDLGIKKLAVVSFGNEKIEFNNINRSKRVKTLEHKFKHVQKIMLRKYKANNYKKTKNVIKYENIAKEIQYKISNIRNDYIHKTTHTLVTLLPSKVIMEDLNISGMMANRHLAKLVQEQCFAKFIRQMKYKCEWNGIEFIQADRWYPSSKTCSCCGRIKKDLKLSDRVYKCECGLEIDRDYNAAINLMRYVGH